MKPATLEASNILLPYKLPIQSFAPLIQSIVCLDAAPRGFSRGAVVAEINSEIVGMAWTRIMADYGHIDDATPSLAIAVLPEYRGRGIGTALLEQLLEKLRAAGYAAVSLSVQQENPALHLYERLGFEPVRVTDGEIVMRCAL